MAQAPQQTSLSSINIQLIIHHLVNQSIIDSHINLIQKPSLLYVSSHLLASQEKIEAKVAATQLDGSQISSYLCHGLCSKQSLAADNWMTCIAMCQEIIATLCMRMHENAIRGTCCFCRCLHGGVSADVLLVPAQGFPAPSFPALQCIPRGQCPGQSAGMSTVHTLL